jgi:hypothetical protein
MPLTKTTGSAPTASELASGLTGVCRRIPAIARLIKEMDLEELIEHLEDLTVDVNGNDGNTSKVRAFCV